ncbi:hypothetical protein BH11MYX2_BH11MYX2_35440 [soil metagenome]
MQPRGITIQSNVAFVLLLAACGGSSGGSGGGDDGGSDAPVDAPVDSIAGATVSGSVRRTAQPGSGGDARGPIYIAIFDQDPIINRDTAQVIARTVIDNADLSAPNATVSYTLDAVPVRAMKYYFVGFLDDNANVDPMNAANAGPDKGDLVSLDGLASPTLTLATPTAATFDVNLNTMLPF